MHLKILNGVTATSLAPRAHAFGTIQTVAKANLSDGERVEIHDGYGNRAFEFDVAGDGVTAGRVTVNVSTDTTAADVAARLVTAINAATHADGTVFAVTARHVATGLIYLESDNVGTIGNQTIGEFVTNAGFTVANLAGALDGVPMAKGATAGDPKQGFEVSSLASALFVARSRSGSGTMTFQGRLWGMIRVPGYYQGGAANINDDLNRSGEVSDALWVPLGVASLGGADANRGLLNNEVTIAESFSLTDELEFATVIGDLRHFERVLCQVTTLGGTSPVLDAYLVTRD